MYDDCTFFQSKIVIYLKILFAIKQLTVKYLPDYRTLVFEN